MAAHHVVDTGVKSWVPLLRSPHPSSTIAALITNGTRVRVKRTGKWNQVEILSGKHAGKVGWITGDVLKPE